MSAHAVLLESLETFAFGLDHPEGACLAPDGRLYVGGEAGQVYRIEGDDSVTELLVEEAAETDRCSGGQTST